MAGRPGRQRHRTGQFPCSPSGLRSAPAGSGTRRAVPAASRGGRAPLPGPPSGTHLPGHRPARAGRPRALPGRRCGVRHGADGGQWAAADLWPDTLPPISAPHPMPFDEITPRNCMPSPHTAWAVTLFVHSRTGSRAMRYAGTFRLVGTLGSTLGFGYHYGVDIIAGMVFALTIEAAMRSLAQGWDRSGVGRGRPDARWWAGPSAAGAIARSGRTGASDRGCGLPRRRLRCTRRDRVRRCVRAARGRRPWWCSRWCPRRRTARSWPAVRGRGRWRRPARRRAGSAPRPPPVPPPAPTAGRPGSAPCHRRARRSGFTAQSSGLTVDTPLPP